MSELTFDILKLVVTICCALITIYIIPLIKKMNNNKDMDDIYNIVLSTVKAAEQTMTGGQVKKKYVMNAIVEFCNAKNIKITVDQISDLIEAAVYTIKNCKDE